MSQYVKHRVKNAVTFISDFERVKIEEARRSGCDSVVCGHIHQAEMREIDGMLYCNDGDWVESMAALVESHDGSLELVHWRTRMCEPLNLGLLEPLFIGEKSHDGAFSRTSASLPAGKGVTLPAFLNRRDR